MPILKVLINLKRIFLIPKRIQTNFNCSWFLYYHSAWKKCYSYFGIEYTKDQLSCVKLFVNQLLILEKNACDYFKAHKALEMSSEEKEQFEAPTTCWLCEEPFSQKIEEVEDHDHLTGKFRGAAHNKCNLNCKQKSSNFVPIVLQNFSGYDCHLIYEHLLTQANYLGLPIIIIPMSLENYVAV